MPETEFDGYIMIVVDCDVCNGRGTVGMPSTVLGRATVAVVFDIVECLECNGTGTVPVDVVAVIE